MHAMATPVASRLGRLLASVLALVVFMAVTPVSAGAATMSAEKLVPGYASNNALQLTLSTKPGLQFTTIPLTENLGLNESQITLGAINIAGELKPANASNYKQIHGSGVIAYLPCDKSGGDSFVATDKMLNDLMSQRPQAILLYSTSHNWCSFNQDPLTYTSILTMADAGEAGNVLNYLSADPVEAVIQGNASHSPSVNEGSSGGGNNSAVAMSILYSITGLITLLFLIIIATGAIRAHRYPERYGPRGAVGGRPRQSRAKGLARAVLDTIPIVKFGNQQTSDKADPELELEPVGTNAAMQQSTKGRRADPPASTSPRQPSSNGAMVPTAKAPAVAEGGQTDDGQLGCSICTEDFKVGEDVRVLPCNHQYHPNCVDPWLVNVSGTCPLCRLDLRPGHGSANESPAGADNGPLPPPLALEGEDGQGSSATHGNRFARFLDINRLRQAPVEERIEALRQMRAQTNEHASQGGENEGRPAQGARLTKKLKEKFRIRTRAQVAARR